MPLLQRISHAVPLAFITLASAFVVPSAHTQVFVGKLLGGESVVYVGLSGYLTDTNNLATALANAGYGTLDEGPQQWIAHGSEVALGHVALGLEHLRMFGTSINRGPRPASIRGSSTQFRVGASIRRGLLRIAPTVDVGLSTYRLRLEESALPPTVENVFTDPQQESNLQARSLLIGGSLGARYIVRGIAPRTWRWTPGVTVGIRAGYLVAPRKTAWEFDDGTELRGGIDVALAGPYARITVGVFTSGKAK
jgi:hypothetical protein